jgi:hypothetical protein
MLEADILQEAFGMIGIIGGTLYQWDTGRLVKVTDNEADHVHFANKGDSEAVIMDLSDSQSKIPDYLLQTGKQLCVYAVKNGITVESKTLFVSKRERPENYVYEEDKRNFIYALITGAQEATNAANQASAAATQASQSAVEAAKTASASANTAKNAAEDAKKATASANEAAVKAAQTAKSLMVVGVASGTNIYLDDAIEQHLVGLRIFGKTTQDGTPTPDTPVDLVSVGDSGSITVNVTGENDARGMTIATPNGLPGIPVSEGGNYTDANGQQWICDEIDLARCVYVQRIGYTVLDGTQTYGINLWQLSTHGCYLFEYRPNDLSPATTDHPAISDKLTNDKWGLFSATETRAMLYATSGLLIVFLPDQTIQTVEAFKSYLANNPICVLYQIKTPIETPLSEEEIAAYSALHTYRNHTTISNDASAHMELEYVMDAKKYIDSLMTGTILPATVE